MKLQNTQTDWSGVGGVEWSWWSEMTVLGVECSQTGPISVSLVINTYSLRVENRRRLKQRRSLQSIILTA